jgi:hypothetical protein
MVTLNFSAPAGWRARRCMASLDRKLCVEPVSTSAVTVPVDLHWKQHRLCHLDARHGMKGDDEGGRIDRPVGRDAGLGECGGVELHGEGLHLRVVDGLQVEQVGARMTRRVWLVAVEAQALAAPLELLG